MNANWNIRGGVAICAGALALAQVASAALITPDNVNTIVRPGYAIATFSTVQAGEWQIPGNMIGTTVEVLVVGGGGGGGAYWGGGGGAGGLIYFGTDANRLGFSYDIAPHIVDGKVAVAVGNGGAGAVADGPARPGGVGGNSSFAALVALGGGGGVGQNSGGGTFNYTTQNGGSAGGGWQTGTALQPGSASGGYGNVGSAADSGAGGGAGAAASGNAGGAGLQYSITGSSQFYAGGGGGGGGLGGSNIGGNGGWWDGMPGQGATSGAANTGSGGGAGRGGWNGGAGGSGVVIVAYAIPEPASGMLMFSAAAVIALIRRKIRG